MTDSLDNLLIKDYNAKIILYDIMFLTSTYILENGKLFI